MGVLSLIWGILAFLAVMVGAIPCLGSLNWFVLPFAGIGLLISIIAVATAEEKPKGMAIAGIVLCALAGLIGTVRLFLGGGVV